jgi:3,2-trans-enoyl-CoA isomerase
MIVIENHGAIRELRLARPPVNALNPALISALNEALEAAPADGAEAIVLSGLPGLFSAGLDVRELASLDRDAMQRFLTDFQRTQQLIAASPVPVVAAITGHCPAGGTVLALFCDYRIMARGPFSIGLNEVQVGLYPGEVIANAFTRLVGSRRAADLLTRGALIDSDAALAAGLVDELADPAAVVLRARDYAAGLLALPPNAYRRTRSLVRRELSALFADSREDLATVIAEHFFSDETRQRMAALLKK